MGDAFVTYLPILLANSQLDVMFWGVLGRSILNVCIVVSEIGRMQDNRIVLCLDLAVANSRSYTSLNTSVYCRCVIPESYCAVVLGSKLCSYSIILSASNKPRAFSQGVDVVSWGCF